MWIVIIALLLLLPGAGMAATYEGSLEPTVEKRNYLAIEFISTGPSDVLSSRGDVDGLPPSTPQESTLRVVIYRSETYQELILEKITTGLEGCCAKLASTRRANLEAFAAHFGFDGEVSGLVFQEWTSPRTFRFAYKGNPFQATVFDSGAITIEQVDALTSASDP